MTRMTTPALSRLVLLGPAETPRDSAKIRRYRLARLKLDGAPERPRGDARYAHLKRVYD